MFRRTLKGFSLRSQPYNYWWVHLLWDGSLDSWPNVLKWWTVIRQRFEEAVEKFDKAISLRKYARTTQKIKKETQKLIHQHIVRSWSTRSVWNTFSILLCWRLSYSGVAAAVRINTQGFVQVHPAALISCLHWKRAKPSSWILLKLVPFLLEFIFPLDLMLPDVLRETDDSELVINFSELLPLDEPLSEISLVPIMSAVRTVLF